MFDWKNFWKNEERRFYPELVVPLPRDSPTATPAADAQSEKSKNGPGFDSSSPDQTSLQEKGVAHTPASTELTLESLRAEVEAGVVASRHDTVYDRTF